MGGIAGLPVVGANVNAAPGHDGGGVGVGAQGGDPFDVQTVSWVESFREARFGGNHVAGPGLPPLRLVGRRRRAGPESEQGRKQASHMGIEILLLRGHGAKNTRAMPDGQAFSFGRESVLVQLCITS